MASSRTEIDILISMKILFVSKLESNMASKSSCFELKSYNVRLLGGRELHFFLHKSVKLIVIRLKVCLLHSWE